MIATSTTEAVRYTPPWREGEDGAPVYLLRAGSVIERGRLEAELAGPDRAGRIFGHELREAIRTGVSTLLSDDPELDRLLGLLESEADGETIVGDDQNTLVEVRKVLAEHWGPYRDLVAQLERRRELAPIEALRRFLLGFENVDAAFSKGRDGMVSDATLAAIDPLEMMAAGNHAYALLYGGGQERNFPQPSASDDARSSSNSGTRRAAGSSGRRRGPKTPA